jgi:hypothetical protein
MFGNKVLRIIFGPKGEEVKGGGKMSLVKKAITCSFCLMLLG